jgi:hypothetical protein
MLVLKSKTSSKAAGEGDVEGSGDVVLSGSMTRQVRLGVHLWGYRVSACFSTPSSRADLIAS